MVSRQLSRVVRQLRQITRPPADYSLTDAQLLECFVNRRDEAAFELLLARHGPMVLALCRQLLRNTHDAEDAFQATFLVLIRKAGSLRERDLVGNWLHGVAYRIAVRLRTSKARRQTLEQHAVDRFAPAPAQHELRWLLQEELLRLPERYRQPIVLCYLEGQTNEEAARLLRWPLGTVKGRLARARELLRRRLTRRGVSLSSAALAAALTSSPASALPPPLIVSTVEAALGFTAGKAAALGGVSSAVLALVSSSLRAMALVRVKGILVLTILFGLLAPGAGWVAHYVLSTSGISAKDNPPTTNRVSGLRLANAPQPGDKTVDLGPRFAPGRPFYQETTVDVNQTMAVGAKEMKQNQTLNFWTCWTPMPKTADPFVIRLKILALKMKIQIADNKIQFDSTEANQPSNNLARLAAALKKAELTVYLNADEKSEGYLAPIRVEGLRALHERLDRIQPGLKAFLGEESFKDLVSPVHGALPGHAVRRDDDWTARARRDLGPLGHYLSTNRFKYLGRAGGLDCIDVKTSLKYAAPPAGQAGMPFTITKVDLKTHEGSGIVLFNRVRGRIDQLRMETTIAGSLAANIGGMKTTVNVMQRQRTTMRTTDTEPLFDRHIP